MTLSFSRASAAFLAVLALALAPGLLPTAAAQGTQTSTLSGTVTSTDGAVLPGVTVTLSSPSLQGQRAAITDDTGSYIFRGLSAVERDVTIALGTAPSVDAALGVATLTETVTVSEVAPSILETTVVGANFKAAEVDKLPTGRTIQNIAEMAPGLTDNTPNVGQQIGRAHV